MKITRFAAPLSALALAFAATNAQAADWQTTYQTTIGDYPDVTNIIEFVVGDAWSGNASAYSASGGQTTNLGTTWANVPSAPTGSFLMGLVEDWSGNMLMESAAPAGVHLVLFTNPGAAGGNGGEAWPFATPEATLIEAVWNATQLDDQGSWETLLTFKDSAEVGSSWFATAGGNFNVVAYSTGTLIGYGTVTAVPEPREWALMLAGIGVVGWAARRNRVRGSADPTLGCAPA